MPAVLLDDDQQGRLFAEAVRKGPIYKGSEDRVLNVRDFAGGMEKAEVEDLIPVPLLADAVSRVVRGKDDDFKDAVKAGSPVVPQIEAYAAANGATLVEGWKVDLAREVKRRLLRDIDKIEEKDLDEWAKLFARFEE